MIVHLDCTLRDGGYYNNWDFPLDVANRYLAAMSAAGVNVVELGMRSLFNNGFKGASAFSTERYLQCLNIPTELKVAVMVNASELVDNGILNDGLYQMFPLNAADSLVDVVRIACHVHEFNSALPACNWLKEKGYLVGFNLMQVADRSKSEIEELSRSASKYPIDALYFADSMGSMDPAQTGSIISALRTHWKGGLGIHTHDNMGLALQNTLRALDDGVTWLDSTVTGMGRGPGNARTEELVIELSARIGNKVNIVPLMSLIKSYFQPLKNSCGWGSNPYYYLTGKYGIHPSFVQEMLADSRYNEEDIIATIEHLKDQGGKKFSHNALDASRHFYHAEAIGSWQPNSVIAGKEVFILGAGPGVAAHKDAIEHYIRTVQPYVIALNTQSSVEQELIQLRVACHPVRLMADIQSHHQLPQPLVTPVSALTNDLLQELEGKHLLDFGIAVKPGEFSFSESTAIIPNALVISYALAIANSGSARRIILAGFDGYGADDPRTEEMQNLFMLYQDRETVPVVSVTPTTYSIPTVSIYGL